MSGMIFFTICNHEYLTEAIVSINSFKRHYASEGISFKIFVIDDVEDKHVNDLEIISVLRVIGAQRYKKLSYKFNITEFSTAVKPSCFKYNFGLGFSNVYYFDPDTYFISDKVDFIIPKNKLVSATYHRNNIKNTAVFRQVDIIRNGLLNFGYLGLKNTVETQQMLNEWESFNEQYCFSDQNTGYFTDQLFALNILGIFRQSIHILDETKFNLAYWNVDQNPHLESACMLHFSKVNRKQNEKVWQYLDSTSRLYVSYLNQYWEELIDNGEYKKGVMLNRKYKVLSEKRMLRNKLEIDYALNICLFYIFFPLLKHLSFDKLKRFLK